MSKVLEMKAVAIALAAIAPRLDVIESHTAILADVAAKEAVVISKLVIPLQMAQVGYHPSKENSILYENDKIWIQNRLSKFGFKIVELLTFLLFYAIKSIIFYV